MKHTVTLSFDKAIEISHSNVEFAVMTDGKKLGTLVLSKGSIDWRPARKQSAVTKLRWSRFAELMVEAGAE